MNPIKVHWLAETDDKPLEGWLIQIIPDQNNSTLGAVVRSDSKTISYIATHRLTVGKIPSDPGTTVEWKVMYSPEELAILRAREAKEAEEFPN